MRGSETEYQVIQELLYPNKGPLDLKLVGHYLAKPFEHTSRDTRRIGWAKRYRNGLVRYSHGQKVNVREFIKNMASHHTIPYFMERDIPVNVLNLTLKVEDLSEAIAYAVEKIRTVGRFPNVEYLDIDQKLPYSRRACSSGSRKAIVPDREVSRKYFSDPQNLVQLVEDCLDNSSMNHSMIKCKGVLLRADLIHVVNRAESVKLYDIIQHTGVTRSIYQTLGMNQGYAQARVIKYEYAKEALIQLASMYLGLDPKANEIVDLNSLELDGIDFNLREWTYNFLGLFGESIKEGKDEAPQIKEGIQNLLIKYKEAIPVNEIFDLGLFGRYMRTDFLKFPKTFREKADPVLVRDILRYVLNEIDSTVDMRYLTLMAMDIKSRRRRRASGLSRKKNLSDMVIDSKYITDADELFGLFKEEQGECELSDLSKKQYGYKIKRFVDDLTGKAINLNDVLSPTGACRALYAKLEINRKFAKQQEIKMEVAKKFLYKVAAYYLNAELQEYEEEEDIDFENLPLRGADLILRQTTFAFFQTFGKGLQQGGEQAKTICSTIESLFMKYGPKIPIGSIQNAGMYGSYMSNNLSDIDPDDLPNISITAQMLKYVYNRISDNGPLKIPSFNIKTKRRRRRNSREKQHKPAVTLEDGVVQVVNHLNNASAPVRSRWRSIIGDADVDKSGPITLPDFFKNLGFERCPHLVSRVFGKDYQRTFAAGYLTEILLDPILDAIKEKPRGRRTK